MRTVIRKDISISIIDTQMQLINVVELVNKLGCVNNCVIIGSILPYRIKQLKFLLKQSIINLNFRKVYFVHITQSNSRFSIYLNTFYRFIKIPLIIALNNDVSFSLIGNYLNPTHRYFQFICSKFQKKITNFIVDDGTGTLSCAEARMEEINKRESRISIRNTLDYILYEFLLIKRNYIPQNVIFYTNYDIALKNQEDVMLNDYSYFKNNALKEIKIKPDSIIIIGQCLIEENILSKPDYQEYLSYIISINLGKPIYYCPHPGERHNYVNSKQNIQILSTGFPIELLLSSSNKIKVFGLYSSALYNLRRMDANIEINALIIDPRHICDSSLVIEIEDIYKSFEKIGIKLIKKVQI